ncbi:MAG: hypothetical protein IPN80_01205 [Flavobacterium sp.]|nr:hypothetical protein [Flavobacterium sp.]
MLLSQPIESIITDTEIVLNPIYFEYNKSNITQEGAFELDKLVQVMKSNDKLVILAKSHTDNREVMLIIYRYLTEEQKQRFSM